MTSTDQANHRPFVARTLLFAAAFLFSHSLFQAHANDRVALVVGIDSYAHATPLNNAVSDSRLVSKVLKETGFNVVALENPGVDEFYEGLDKLSRRASLAKVGIVYFAGHGVEVGGENYLLPVDAELEREVQLRSQAISLETILEDLGEARLEAKVVILDCCRDNPLKQRTWMKTRSAGRGLAPILDVNMPEGSLVFFSAGPGQVALDGDDGNSPFTKALASQLLIPGQDLFRAVINTSDNVADETGGRQEPWVKMDASGRALRKLVLVPMEKTSAPTGTVTTIAGAPATGNTEKPAHAGNKPQDSATAASTTATVNTAQVGNKTENKTPAPTAGTTAADSMKETVAANTTPGAEGAAEPTIGNTTVEKKEEVKPLVLPSRGYFNNTEVFESGPYSGYNTYSKNKILRSAQGKLTGAGTPDGIMGRKTQSALQSYQTANNLPVTGRLDTATLTSMGLTGLPEESYTPPAKKTYTPKKTYSKPSSTSSSSGTRSSGSSSSTANRSSGSSNNTSSSTRRTGPMMPPGFPPAPSFPHPTMKKSSSGSSSGGYSPPKRSSRMSHARKKYMRPG